MIEHRSEHCQREQAKRYGGDPRNLSLVHGPSHSFQNRWKHDRSGRRRLDMFDAFPLWLIPHLVAPPDFCTRTAEGEENREGKKSVKESSWLPISLELDGSSPLTEKALHLPKFRPAAHPAQLRCPSERRLLTARHRRRALRTHRSGVWHSAAASFGAPPTLRR
jgi:hypothetical protein